MRTSPTQVLAANGLLYTLTMSPDEAAALAVGVGFLPVVGGLAGMTPLVTGAAVSLLAVTGVFVQPWAPAGRRLLADQLGRAGA